MRENLKDTREEQIQVLHRGKNPLREIRKEKHRKLDSQLVPCGMLQNVARTFSDDESFIVHIYRNFSSLICFYYSGLEDPLESQTNEINKTTPTACNSLH
jgi:hypothetical protein